MDRRNALILLSLMAIAAVVGSTVYTVYAADNEEESNNGFVGWANGMTGPEARGPLGGRRHGWEGFGFIEVDEEYEETVVNIAESDPDVQNLLNDGYSVIGVRPNVTTKVDAEGNVAAKATSAVVVLQKDTTGRASVWVNLEEAKITKIVIFTTTVIEKA